MSDETISFRLTIWIDDTEYDWRYTIPEDVLDRRDRIENHRVPVDDWPDALAQLSTDDLEGREFVATSSAHEHGLSGPIESVESRGTVLVLDTDAPSAYWGEDFGDETALGGPTGNSTPQLGKP